MADGVNRENRLRIPVKLKAELSGGKSASEEKGKEPQTPEEMWARPGQQGVYGLPWHGQRRGKPTPANSTPVNPREAATYFWTC